eukprot:c29043_g1_i1 orf=587-3001(-)
MRARAASAAISSLQGVSVLEYSSAGCANAFDSVGSSVFLHEKGMAGVRVVYSPCLSKGFLRRCLHVIPSLQLHGSHKLLHMRESYFGNHYYHMNWGGRAFHNFGGPKLMGAHASAQSLIIDDDRFDDTLLTRDVSNTSHEYGDLRHGKTNPSGGEEGLDISKLGICQDIVDALAQRSITHLFPIQRAVFEPAMKGKDLIARAKTGTGKTLAFGIPILDSIIRSNEKNRSNRRFGKAPLALVLAPTRELAKQVEREFKETAPKLETICVYGGVSIMLQQRQLNQGVDVAVGTPGRIIDLLERGSLNLREAQFVVLDEADQMLAVGFAEDVEKILENLPAQRQSMLFSATMPDWVKKLSKRFLQSPIIIDLVGQNDEKLAEGIKLFSVSTVSSAKRSILSDLIMVYAKGGKTIVFTQTKRDADEVAFSMGQMHGCEALHGDITQLQREKRLGGFREGRFSVLVATDVAARGLDIPNVDLIIHYEIPNDSETFVHRSGRTGRAGKEGTAILMHTEQQRRTVRTIERDVGCKFEQITPPSLEDVLRSSSEQASSMLKKVHPDLKCAFLPTAQKLIREEGPEALAAAIAHLCGFTQPPASRSLLTHDQGWMTLRITRSGGGLPLSSTRAVMGTLGRIYPTAADEVGKIYMLDEGKVEGAVFDLPEDIAKKLLSMDIGSGDCIDAPKQLPRIVEDTMPSDRYGRTSFGRSGGFSSGGFGGRGGYSSGGFSGRGMEFRGLNERSGYGRDNGGMSGRGMDFRGTERAGYGGADRFIRPSGVDNGGRWFIGKCLSCGQSGHRAAECPSSTWRR